MGLGLVCQRSRSRSRSLILKVLVSERVVSVSNGIVSVLVSISDDEVSVSVSVSDDEAETPSLLKICAFLHFT